MTADTITIEIPALATAKVWACRECEHVTGEEPDLDKLYQCSECESVFRSANGGGMRGTQCPDDSRFGRRYDEGDRRMGVHVCPECEAGEADEAEREVCPECDPGDEEAAFDSETDYVKHYIENHY